MKSKFVEQDDHKASYAHKIQKAEGKINWNNRADEILGLVNGLFPTPELGLFTKVRGRNSKSRIRNAKGEPGIVLSENLEIGCKEKSLKIVEIQREGKKLKNREFLLDQELLKVQI